MRDEGIKFVTKPQSQKRKKLKFTCSMILLYSNFYNMLLFNRLGAENNLLKQNGLRTVDFQRKTSQNVLKTNTNVFVLLVTTFFGG